MRVARKKHQKPDYGRAVGYLRASTSSQRNGPEAQRDAIRRHAEARGIQVVGWAEDLGTSGGTAPSDREGFTEALALMDRAGAGLLLVSKRCRIARDTMHVACATRLVERQGGRIASADGLSAEDSPEGKLLRHLVDGFAEFERSLIRARTQAALAARRDRGLRYTRFPPYGYYWKDGVAVPDDHEQRTLVRMRTLRDRGLSYRAVGERLLREGRRPRMAEKWSVTVLRRLLLRSEAS